METTTVDGEKIDVRKTMSWWDKQVKTYRRRWDKELTEYARYAKWHEGDMSDVVGAIQQDHGMQGVVSSNLHHLVVRASIAEMMFRAPRFQVREVDMMGNEPLTSPKLAEVQTRLLNDWVLDVDLFREGRRAITDAFLSDMMVMKVGYTADIGVDSEEVDRQRAKAKEEVVRILGGSRPRIAEDDMHSVFIEEEDAVLAGYERGDFEQVMTILGSDVDYLKERMKKRQEILDEGGGRPRESIRSERVFAKRIKRSAFFHDPYAERPDDWEWVAEEMLIPEETVRENPLYDATLRDMARASIHFESEIERALDPDGYGEEPTLCRVLEVVDLRRGRVLTFVEGIEKAVRDVPYHLRSLLPAGPYITASLSVSALTDRGIPPPRIYEGEQTVYALLKSTIASTARRMTPMMGIVTKGIDRKTVNELRSGKVCNLIAFQQLPQDRGIRDMLFPVPMPEFPPGLLAAAGMFEHDVERLSGHGSAGLAGGDFSRTATASAVVAESGASLTDDLMSVLDDFWSRLGRAVVRLQRRFYNRARVGELVGAAAMAHWPMDGEGGRSGFTERDIKNDRGVEVIPGSTRRRVSAVEQKLLTELYAAMARNPAIEPTVVLEVLQRIANAMGIQGLEIRIDPEMARLQQMTQASGGSLPEEEGGPERRVKDGTQEGQMSGILQGTNNPGAGTGVVRGGAGVARARGSRGSPRSR